MQKHSRSDIHETVTQRIIALLETAQHTGATMPWCKPGVAHARPINAVTQKPYRGINILSLWAAADAASYKSGVWATFKQWKELGASVKKGETASPIVFYKSIDLKDDTAEIVVDGDELPKSFRIAKGYWGFNADQVEGYALPDVPAVDLVARLERVDTFIAATGADIRHGGARAFYRPSDDFIQMPERSLFRDTPSSTATEGYYAVLCHELGHYAAFRIMPRRHDSSRTGRNHCRSTSA